MKTKRGVRRRRVSRSTIDQTFGEFAREIVKRSYSPDPKKFMNNEELVKRATEATARSLQLPLAEVQQWYKSVTH